MTVEIYWLDGNGNVMRYEHRKDDGLMIGLTDIFKKCKDEYNTITYLSDSEKEMEENLCVQLLRNTLNMEIMDLKGRSIVSIDRRGGDIYHLRIIPYGNILKIIDYGRDGKGTVVGTTVYRIFKEHSNLDEILYELRSLVKILEEYAGKFAEEYNKFTIRSTFKKFDEQVSELEKLLLSEEFSFLKPFIRIKRKVLLKSDVEVARELEKGREEFIRKSDEKFFAYLKRIYPSAKTFRGDYIDIKKGECALLQVGPFTAAAGLIICYK